MLTMDEARRRVARGAALLDRLRPGWDNRIDLGLLTLSQCARCVLGQLIAESGLLWHDVPRVFFWNEGLCLSDGGFFIQQEDSETQEEAYRPLQDAWVTLIADRRLSQAHELPASADAVARTDEVPQLVLAARLGEREG